MAGDQVTALTVDELDRASALVAAGKAAAVAAYFGAELAAYIEWYWLLSSGHAISRLSDEGPFVDFDTRLRSRDVSWSNGRQGFIRVNRAHTDIENAQWVQFLFGLQRTAVNAGFEAGWAKQLTGAIGELEDNIHWHSDAPASGLVAYSADDGQLDVVVMDRGVGVLESLKRAEEFAAMEDHGSALEVAIRDGASRYGTSSGRGWGFNPLFVGLANRDARLRFRSGDHLLQLAGHGPKQPDARLRQLAFGQGFLIAVRALA